MTRAHEPSFCLTAGDSGIDLYHRSELWDRSMSPPYQGVFRGQDLSPLLPPGFPRRRLSASLRRPARGNPGEAAPSASRPTQAPTPSLYIAPATLSGSFQRSRSLAPPSPGISPETSVGLSPPACPGEPGGSGAFSLAAGPGTYPFPIYSTGDPIREFSEVKISRPSFPRDFPGDVCRPLSAGLPGGTRGKRRLQPRGRPRHLPLPYI